MNNFDNIAKNTLDEWINFLKTEEVKEGTKAKGLKEAKEEIAMLKLNKEAMAEYDRDIEAWRDYSSSMSTNFLAGKIEGMEEKRKKGDGKATERERQTKLEMAKKCKQCGMPIPEIADLTGLTEDEIKSTIL